MARRPRITRKPAPQDDFEIREPRQPRKVTVSVEYRPLERTDTWMVEWNGIRFGANQPVALDPDNPRHYVMVPQKKTRVQEGMTLTFHEDGPVFMGEIAKTNPYFAVDGVQAPRMVSTRKVPRPGEEWSAQHRGEVMDAAMAETMVGQISGIAASRR